MQYLKKANNESANQHWPLTQNKQHPAISLRTASLYETHI